MTTNLPIENTTINPVTTVGANDTSSNVINSANLAPVTPAVIPVPTPDTTDYGGITNGVINSLDTLTTQSNDSQKKVTDSQNSIIDTMNAALGKTADTQAANESTGLNDATKQLNLLNAQAKSLNREASAIPIQTQENNKNTGATDAGVAPQTAGALRLNALKALSIAQQADIATANYTAAKDKAQQIIDLKYKPLEAQLEIKKQQYEFNKDALASIDKKRTDALGIALKKEEQDLADKKQKAKDIQDILLKASQFNAPQTVLDAIKNSTDANSAAIAGKGYLTDPLDTQLKKAQIAEAYSKVNENNNTAKDQKIVKINGTDYVQNKNGSFSLPNLPNTPGGDANKSVVQNKIAQIGAVIGAKGEASSVGTNFLSRQGAERAAVRILTLGSTGLGVGNRANFTATVEQITKGLTLQALIDAKANGATFGALSEGELSLLADSASKIDNYAVKDKSGKVLYYKANEADFNNELKTLQDGLQKAYNIKYGETDANNYLDTVSSALKTNTSIYSQAGYNVNQ